jgi:lipid-A-disaccharide synthase
MELAKSKPTEEKIITLVPGSRVGEVKKLMPVFRRVVETLSSCGYRGYKFAIPTVETTERCVRAALRDWTIKPDIVGADVRYDLYRRTYVAIAASGTVSVELAMLHVPTIVTYKMNPITTLIGRLLIKVRWVSLVNILLNRSVYPEFLGADATAENIINEFDSIILPANRDKMITELHAADNMWVRPEGVASQIIADDILNVIPH